MPGTLLGVVHLRALPGAGGGAFPPVLEAALADARAFAAGGADGVIIENLGDAPFRRGDAGDPVTPDVPAALAVVAREVAGETGLPVGVNCLRNDGRAALGVAAVTGARWVRINVLSGAMVTDQGLIQGEAAALAAWRRQLGHRVELLADLLVKHATPLAPVDPAAAARDLAERSGADGLVVSGARTGAPVDIERLRIVREAVPGFAVWIGSGLDAENAAALRALADGAIAGTACKTGGDVRAPVDARRVARLVRAWQAAGRANGGAAP